MTTEYIRLDFRCVRLSSMDMGDMTDLREPRNLARQAFVRRTLVLPSAEFAIIVPTYNESGNVAVLAERIASVMSGRNWELIFVDDDSSDGTSAIVRSLAREDFRIRCIQRIGRRGLSSACIEGIMATAAPYVVVMDADMQHDERLLPQMFDALATGDQDIVVGSRYAEGGSIGAWDKRRAAISRVTGWLSRMVIRSDLRDPMSGFFGITRTHFESCVRELSKDGFKILLDLFASSKGRTRFVELPYEFRSRTRGESKLDSRVSLDFLKLLLDKSIGRYVPVNFLIFGFIGALGLGVHLVVLAFCLKVVGTSFMTSQLVATFTAMTFNFFLNNSITYRDRRQHGWRLVAGLASFVAICSLGAVANVGIATILFRDNPIWWLAGIAGAVVGSVWNYAMTSTFTWKRA